MDMIVFNGTSSDDLNLIVEQYPEPTYPKRRNSKFTIQGRSGTFYTESGEFENVDQLYNVYLSADPGNVQEYAAKVGAWLCGPKGYCRMEDSYTPETYRMAMFMGPLNIENTLNSFGRAKLEFECLPFRYLKSGDFAFSCASGESITNPTAFDAYPLLTLSGTGAGSVTAAGITISISEIGGKILIDCETMDAYSEDGANKNSAISAVKFPILTPGENSLTYSGGVTSLQVKPRWRTV